MTTNAIDVTFVWKLGLLKLSLNVRIDACLFITLHLYVNEL